MVAVVPASSNFTKAGLISFPNSSLNSIVILASFAGGGGVTSSVGDNVAIAIFTLFLDCQTLGKPQTPV